MYWLVGKNAVTRDSQGPNPEEVHKRQVLTVVVIKSLRDLTVITSLAIDLNVNTGLRRSLLGLTTCSLCVCFLPSPNNQNPS